jgi:hypothetical protein
VNARFIGRQIILTAEFPSGTHTKAATGQSQRKRQQPLRKPKKGNPSQSRALKALITPDLNIRSVGRQGWEQLLTWKKEILDAFDRGRRYARGHEVETYHGLVAEAHFQGISSRREFQRKLGLPRSMSLFMIN